MSPCTRLPCRQSCEVALDAADYFGQAANGADQHEEDAADRDDEHGDSRVQTKAALEQQQQQQGSAFAREKALAGVQQRMGDLHFNRVER